MSWGEITEFFKDLAVSILLFLSLPALAILCSIFEDEEQEQ